MKDTPMLTPRDFKRRWLDLLPPENASMNLGLERFAEFPDDVLGMLELSLHDSAILRDAGLPVDGASFLSFGRSPHYVLQILENDRVPDAKQWRLIGHTGSGDPICLHSRSGEIIYFDHDNTMAKVFMNSSITTLALSLCAFASLVLTKDSDRCRHEISETDPRAIESGSFWAQEIVDWASSSDDS
jgi:hypothetical protein